MEFVTSEKMHRIDQLASERYGIPSLVLMENAARGAFEYISNHVNKDKKILCVCGSGNNGGDGFAIARLLFISGFEVAINFVGSEDKLTEDARTNYNICRKLSVCFVNTIEADVIIDCIFGTGLKREVIGKYAEIITRINLSSAYIFAIDIPSGLGSDDGLVKGVCVKADTTLTFQLGKVGMYCKQGKDFCGQIEIIDIFIPKELLEE